MPKLKTKSGAKKRFKLTGTGKVVYAQRGKQPRHDQAHAQADPRSARHAILFKTDGDKVKKFYLPNG